MAYAGMAPSLTPLGSGGIEADIPISQISAHHPRRGTGCLGNEQLCSLISFIFDMDVHLFTIPTALLLVTIAHTCHESTPPHTCSLALTMLLSWSQKQRLMALCQAKQLYRSSTYLHSSGLCSGQRICDLNEGIKHLILQRIPNHNSTIWPLYGLWRCTYLYQ